MLGEMRVRYLVLPAMKPVVSMWRRSFGFVPLDMHEYRALEDRCGPARRLLAMSCSFQSRGAEVCYRNGASQLCCLAVRCQQNCPSIGPCVRDVTHMHRGSHKRASGSQDRVAGPKQRSAAEETGDRRSSRHRAGRSGAPSEASSVEEEAAGCVRVYSACLLHMLLLHTE